MGDLSGDEVIEELTAVKGIGGWSAHLFLLFERGRPAVLPAGDLRVRHGMRGAHGLAAPPPPACPDSRSALNLSIAARTAAFSSSGDRPSARALSRASFISFALAWAASTLDIGGGASPPAEAACRFASSIAAR